jgi:hypothetical protein
MNKMKTLLLALTVGILMGSNAMAQSFPDTWKSYDLSEYGMSFSIMAPASAEFDFDSDSDELYIDAEADGYRLMISNYDEPVADLVAEYKEEVEDNEDAPLAEYVMDEKNGFLAKEDLDGEFDYEIYFAFVNKGKTYFVQANPKIDGGYYTEEEAVNMFNALKKAAGL